MGRRPEGDATAATGRGVGRFLRGEIIDRFFDGEQEGRSGRALSLAMMPLTVTLTDTVREITETSPHGRDVVGGVGGAITEYTTTIPAITQTVTQNVTLIP
jgi:hypothetical protein